MEKIAELEHRIRVLEHSIEMLREQADEDPSAHWMAIQLDEAPRMVFKALVRHLAANTHGFDLAAFRGEVEHLLLTLAGEAIHDINVVAGTEATWEMVREWTLARNREFISEMIPGGAREGEPSPPAASS